MSNMKNRLNGTNKTLYDIRKISKFEDKAIENFQNEIVSEKT